MQRIIKLAGRRIQLFETINFGFMKIFDSLVKIAIFRGLSAFLGLFASQITANQLNYLATDSIFGSNLLRKSPKKKQKTPKNGCFEFEIKNFHKSKVDSLKKFFTRACLFYVFLHFRLCPFTKGQVLKKSVVQFLKFFLYPTPITF